MPPALHLHRMDHTAPTLDRQAYEDVLVRAMRYARRIVPRDQAFEVAHDVALEMLDRPAAQRASGALLFVAVSRRLRNVARAEHRRAARDGAYLEQQSAQTTVWANPDVALETRELGDYIAGIVQRMPDGMRDAFVLVREEGLTYKQAAERLNVGVGTVHTQLSRALTLIRDGVQDYYDDAPGARRTRDGRSR
jgi:RNA polymerase sigma factor (sigma-70 family)